MATPYSDYDLPDPTAGPPVRPPTPRAGPLSALAVRVLVPMVAAALLALAAVLVFLAQSAGSSRALFAPLHDRRPVTVILLVIAAAGWEFILTLVAVRVVHARQIMRRHRLDKIATTRSATDPDIAGSSPGETHPQEHARET